MRSLHHRWIAVAGVAVAGLLTAVAEAAHAATTVTTSGVRLNVTAAAGRENLVSVTASGTAYKVHDRGDTVAAGSGCSAVDARTVACPAAGLLAVIVELGDQDDSASKRAASLSGLIDGGRGDDTLSGGPASGGNALLGGPGRDRLIGGPDYDSLDGGADADELSGGPGGDVVRYSDRVVPVSVTIDGVADDGAAGEADNVGLDVESVYGGAGDDALVGSSASNSIFGGRGDDKISGGDGDDILTGAWGVDSLYGGAGDDRFPGRKQPEGSDVLYGGSGFDKADYSLRAAAVMIDIDDVADDGAPGEGDNVRTDVEHIDGGLGDDRLTGSNLVANRLDGRFGADILNGLSGDDLLIGGSGADSLIGGFGDDQLQAQDTVAANDALDGQLGTDTCDSDAGDTEAGCEI